MENRRTGLQAVGVWFVMNIGINLSAGITSWILVGQFTQLTGFLPFLVAVGGAALWKRVGAGCAEDYAVYAGGTALMGASLFLMGLMVKEYTDPGLISNIAEVLAASDNGYDKFRAGVFWQFFEYFACTFPLNIPTFCLTLWPIYVLLEQLYFAYSSPRENAGSGTKPTEGNEDGEDATPDEK